jgi:CheY-like chemotaxis protein
MKDHLKKIIKSNLNSELKRILFFLNTNSKILIIDDDIFNIKGLQIMFKETFVQVNGRSSVEEGIQELISNEQKPDSHPYTMIFIDVNMPGVSGIEGAQKIK